jgi:excisionase family DNA binding protein
VEPLISVKEAARQLGGVSPWTVYAWLSQGRLQRTKVGSRTMIRQSELLRVINDGGISPSPTRKKTHALESNAASRPFGAHGPSY